MRWILGLAGLVFVSVLAWRIGGVLSADAVGMAVGLLFGVMAGVPSALLVLAAGRRRDDSSGYHPGIQDIDDEWQRARLLPGQAPQNPPAVIVVPPQYTQARPFGPLVNVRRTTMDGVQIDENHLLPPEVAERLYGERRFKVVPLDVATYDPNDDQWQ